MDLSNVNHIDEFRKLFSGIEGDILIVGSSVLALLGFRMNNDIDVWTERSVFDSLETHDGFVRGYFNDRMKYRTPTDTIEVFYDFPPFKNLKFSMVKSICVDGIHFQAPMDVLVWKRQMNRLKDIRDIDFLERYLNVS